MKNIINDIKEDLNGNYTLVPEPSKKEKEYILKTAIGLQAVDGLKPTDYLMGLSNASIENKLTYNQIEDRLNQYQGERKENNRNQQADKVAFRIVKILSSKSFSFSIAQIKSIHGFLSLVF